MRTAIVTAAAALALALGAAPAGAQASWGRWYDPYTGRCYSDFTLRDPWTGVAAGRREVFDPRAGRAVSYPTAYSPWPAPYPVYGYWAYSGPWPVRPRYRWRW